LEIFSLNEEWVFLVLCARSEHSHAGETQRFPQVWSTSRIWMLTPRSSVEGCGIIVHATLSSVPFFAWGKVSSLLDTFVDMYRQTQ
jgi:hypothetical protein